MAKTICKRLFYNLIIVAVLALLLGLSVYGCRSITAVALEQDVRCGLREHTHTESCYLNGVLLCMEKAHNHSENCYLILLQENDVNELLEKVVVTDDKNLNTFLEDILWKAVVNQGRPIRPGTPDSSETTPGTTPGTTPTEPSIPITPGTTVTLPNLTAEDITSLNKTIESMTDTPIVVLNEKLTGTVTLAVGGTTSPITGESPSTTADDINFYLMLDGQIVFVTSGKLTNTNKDSSNRQYSYGNTVNAYTQNNIVTNLSTSNLGNPGTYRIRYNTDGDISGANSFDSSSSYSNKNSRITFNSGSSVRYALLTDSDGDAINFYTVTLDYSGVGAANTVRYVESGESSGLTLSDEYNWYDANGNAVTAMPSTITGTTTLYARPKNYTASFVNSDGTQIATSISGKPTGGELAITLPSLAGTAYDGYYWTVKDGDGTTYASDGTATVSISQNTTFVAIPSKYTVTYIDENKNTSTQTVNYGQTVTLGDLPAGYYWDDEDGNRYSPGDSYGPVTRNMTFTAAARVLNVIYNVNFTVSGFTVPTLYGTDALTVTDTVIAGNSITVRSLTSRKATYERNDTGESDVYLFEGWVEPETGTTVQPDTVLTWAQLEAMADEDGNVYLNGQWAGGSNPNSASFFVRFDSVAVDTNGNVGGQDSSLYTPSVFDTYVGGIPTNQTTDWYNTNYRIADDSSDNSVDADSAIRALEGKKDTGIWLYDFPKDVDVFAWLKQYLADNPSKALTVENITVDPNELDKEHYAIRWYVFKIESGTWHVDGLLYRKRATITVDKAFGGVDTAVAAAENGFHVVAQNGTVNDDGTFTPYASDDTNFRKMVLVLDDATQTALQSTYPDATFQLVNTEDLANGNYEWEIEDVKLGEYWRITESPTAVSGYSYYAEYTVYDTDGQYSAVAEYGTQASVIGKAFALDEDPDQGLMVDFGNYYYNEDQILLKKEDVNTGRGIPGAVFEIWQNGSALKFNYDADTGIYSQSPDGTTTKIVTNESGYAAIDGFSYQHGDSDGDGIRDGDILIKEVVAPSGYGNAPNVVLGLDGSNVVIKDVVGIDEAQWAEHAEVPTNEVAVIKDRPSEFVSVTVNKVWNTTAPADSVEVVLQANGTNIAALVPGFIGAQVELSTDNNWTYTWSSLPRYINGQLVTWSIKEVLIGGVASMTGSDKFANWVVTYPPGVGTDTDSDGDVDSWVFDVVNATRRPQLIVTKVGSDGAALAGAQFRLEQVELVNGSWQTVSGTTAATLTTDARGMLTFDQLMAGAYYRLTETQTPEGYMGSSDPIVFTEDGEGNITFVDTAGAAYTPTDGMVTYTGQYNLQILNMKLDPLPEAGGSGTTWYRLGGLLLMLAAAVMYLYKNALAPRRKEEHDSS